MKRPLVMVAMIYVSGVFLADRFALPLVASFAVSFIAGVMALVSVRQRKWLLPIFILLFGCFNFTVRTQVLSPFDLRSMAPRDPAFVRVEGRLRETPVLRVYERQGKSQIRSMARLQVNGIHLPTGRQEAFGELAISTHGELPSDFCLGAQVEISGVLKQPMGPLAEGLFDYRTYLRRQGIFFQLEVSSPSDWQLISTSKSLPLSNRFGAWAQRTLARGLPEVDDSLRLLWAMVLGWKTALTDEVSEPFMRTGTLHIFAISGLHIALIAGILVALLRVAQCPRAVCGIVLIPLLWFYTAATGWQPSAIRSTIMMSIIIAGWSLRRPSDLVNSLAAAALLILIWDPQQLFQAGFQLSFFVVLSIALFSPHLLQYWQRLIRTDPFLPAELLPRWRRWLNDPLHYLGKSLATSIAAWLGSLPLIAHYFHLVTPVSLLVNLIIVPLSGLALMSSLGALVCGDWFPWCTERFNHCSWFLMHSMVVICQGTAKWPGSFFYVAAPPVTIFIAYYALLIGTLSGWLWIPERRRWSLLLLFALAAFQITAWIDRCDRTTITVLPLPGSCIYVDAESRSQDLMINCGDAAGGAAVVQPFLQAQGLNRLNQLLITHGELAQVGGFIALESNFNIQKVLVSTLRFRSVAYRELIEDLDQTPERLDRVSRSQFVAGWRVLHPQATDRFSTADDGAVVLIREIHGTRILVLSDLGRLGQRALLERERDLRADIVIAGISGNAEPLNAALLERIRPRLIVVACAEFPSSARASPMLRERLRHSGIPVFYTSDQGAVTLRICPEGWRVSVARNGGADANGK